MEFKERIKSLRLEKGLSQSKLAAHLDKTEGAIRTWESGRAKPDIDTLVMLSDFFECTTDYLLGLSEVKSEKQVEKSDCEMGELSDVLRKIPSSNKNSFTESLTHSLSALLDNCSLGTDVYGRQDTDVNFLKDIIHSYSLMYVSANKYKKDMQEKLSNNLAPEFNDVIFSLIASRERISTLVFEAYNRLLTQIYSKII